jgi:hypothetical protein
MQAKSIKHCEGAAVGFCYTLNYEILPIRDQMKEYMR